VNYDLQTSKMELLEAEMTLLAGMNHAAHRRLTVLEDILDQTNGPCSHYDSQPTPDSVDWQQLQKDIDSRKQSVYRALRKSIGSQISAQPVKSARDWEFLELLYDYALRQDRISLNGFVEEIYGSCIGIVHRQMASGLESKAYLRKASSQLAAEDPKALEDACFATGWKTYLPAKMTDCCRDNDTEWTSSKEVRVIQEELADMIEENERLYEELETVEDVRDDAILEAKKWREDFDLYMVCLIL